TICRADPLGGQCTDHDVVPVGIPERKLLSAGIWVDAGFLFEPAEGARSCQRHVEVVDTEKQQETVAGCRVIGAPQRRMVVLAPLVEAEQDGSVRVEDLSEIGMSGR